MAGRETVDTDQHTTANTHRRELSPIHESTGEKIPAANLVQRLGTAPGSLSANSILQLQRVIGNQAVSQLMKSAANIATKGDSATSQSSPQSPFIQSLTCQGDMIAGSQPIQRKLTIATNPKNDKDIHRLKVYQEQLNELYKLGSSERQDLIFGEAASDETYHYTDAQVPEKPNYSWSADLLGTIISNPKTTTIYPHSQGNNAFPRDANTHDKGQACDAVVEMKDDSNTLELAHELIHVSHFNENPHWDSNTRKKPYKWSNPQKPSEEISVPDGQEEARTVGLGEYDLDQHTGKSMTITENDLRYIMGIKKRESYEDTRFEAESDSAAGKHYVNENKRRWAKFAADTQDMSDPDLKAPEKPKPIEQHQQPTGPEEPSGQTIAWKINHQMISEIPGVDKEKLSKIGQLIPKETIEEVYKILCLRLGIKKEKQADFIEQLKAKNAVTSK